MLPDNVLSSQVMAGDFIGAKAFESSPVVDYEDGGVALNNPSLGLMYQLWTCRLSGNDVIVSAPEVADTIIFTTSGITEISFTFDSNMNPALAYIQSSVAKLRWYDTTINDFSIISFDSTVRTPKIVLDDKRTLQSSTRDIILAYVKGGKLCARQQRDRFTIEYELTNALYKGIIKFGMNNKLRLQFLMDAI
jgi:hypothetical protein